MICVAFYHKNFLVKEKYKIYNKISNEMPKNVLMLIRNVLAISCFLKLLECDANHRYVFYAVQSNDSSNMKMKHLKEHFTAAQQVTSSMEHIEFGHFFFDPNIQ